MILDTKRKPVIAWTGDSWSPEEFIDDIESLVEDEGLVETESKGIPGFTAIVSIAAISIAAIRIGRKQISNSE